MKTGGRITIILAGLTLLVLGLSATGSVRDAFDRGDFYLFTRAFFEDIPARLAGPGRFRFVLQPLVAIILGVRGGLADARAGEPPFLYGLLFERAIRGRLLRSCLETVTNLLLMGILMDAVFQWVILGTSNPFAALVVAVVIILTPYAFARALSNRVASARYARGASEADEGDAKLFSTGNEMGGTRPEAEESRSGLKGGSAI